MRKQRVLAVMVAVALAAVVTGCPRPDAGYLAASKQYNEAAKKYGEANAEVNKHKATMTPARWADFISMEHDVIAADTQVSDLLKQWAASPASKPLGYDDAVKTLGDAQDRVIALATEVSQ